MIFQILKSIAKQVIALYKATLFKRAVRRGRLNGHLIILMYHRVLPKNDPRLITEEPGMYVTPETFEMHLYELNKFARFTHIEDWLELCEQDALEDTPYVVITFDDGWADNYEYAFPILKKQNVPACIFLATNYIGSNTTFWPERLAATLINYAQDPSVRFKLDAFFSELGSQLDSVKLEEKNRDYISGLIQSAKQKTDDELNKFLDSIKKPEADVTYKSEMLSWDQVREMSQCGVDFGGHTRSHLRLNNKASIDRVKVEIEGCAQDIESALQQAPTLFCYPNGDVSEHALECVKESYKAAVTTNRGMNINSTDTPPHLLKRIGVHENISNVSRKLLATLQST